MVDPLNRSVTESPQNSVDARLVAGSLRLKPFENILIDSQRNRRLGRQRLKPTTNQSTNDMLHISFLVPAYWSPRRSVGFQTFPISFGLH